MPSLPLLRALGLNFSPNQLEVQPGSLVEASNIIIRRDNVIESRRGYALYGTSMGSASDRCKQLMTYKNKLIRHFSNRLQYEDGLNNAGITSFFDFNEVINGSTSQAVINEAQDGLRIKSIEANSNLYFTSSDGIKKLSSKTADGLGAANITQAGGIKALDVDATLSTSIGNQSGFLTSDSGVSYKVVWGTKDANGNLVLGAPSSAATVLNPLLDLTLRDFSNFLLQVDNVANTNPGSSLITDNNYYSTLALPISADATDLKTNLVAAAQKLDQDLLYATDTGTGLPYNQLKITPKVSTTAITTSGLNTITVTSASGIQEGMSITGNGVSGTVLSVSGTTVTLSSSATITQTAAPVNFYGMGASGGTITANFFNTLSVTASNSAGDLLFTSGAAHGFKVGMPIQFYATSYPGNISSAATAYYVIASGLTATTFKVSAASGGSSVAWSSAGSGVAVGLASSAYFVSADNINVLGFTSNSVAIDSLNSAQTVSSVKANRVSFIPKAYTSSNPVGISGTIVSIPTTTVNNTGTMVLTCPSHGLKNNQKINISGSNSVPKIDGSEYPITYLSDSTFSINLQKTFSISDFTAALTLPLGTINANDTITYANHGLLANDSVVFTSIAGVATGISLNTRYYVINPTTNTFQLSTSIGGSVFDITATSTGAATMARAPTQYLTSLNHGYIAGDVVCFNVTSAISEAVTFTASGSTVVLSLATNLPHGLNNNDTIQFVNNIATTTGISINTKYYVVNATASTFQVAATLNGTPLTLTNNGTGTMQRLVSSLTYYVISDGLSQNTFKVSSTINGSASTLSGSGTVTKQITTAGSSASWNILIDGISSTKIESNTFRSIAAPSDPNNPPTNNDSVALKTYYSNILSDVQNLIAAHQSTIVDSTIYNTYLAGLDVTESASAQLKFTIPSSILNYSAAQNPYFYQIYRTGIAVVSGVSTMADIAIITEFKQIEEAFPTQTELTQGIVNFLDQTPESIAGTGAYLYTNERSGEGALQANDVPPFATDINRFKGYTFFSNTKTKQRKSITLLGVVNMLNSYNPANPYKLTISNGQITNTYTFVKGAKEISTITCAAASTLAASGTASYFLLNSANNETQYYIWYNIGTATDPAISGKIGIPVVVNSGDTGLVVTQKTINAVNNVMTDFIASNSVVVSNVDIATDTITANNHGFTNGALVSFVSTLTLPTYTTPPTYTNSISLNGSYYIINATTNTFQLSLSSGGSAIDLVSAGTGVITAIGSSSTSTNCSITNAKEGSCADISIGTLPVGFSVAVTQQGIGEDASSHQVLISSNDSAGIAIEDTAKSLIRIINRNSNEFVNAFYISGTTTAPGTILLESKNLNDSKFYLLGSSSVIGASFNPDLSPGSVGITGISVANPTVITTLNNNFLPAAVNIGTETITIAGHGFSEGSQIVFSSSGTLPSPLVSGIVYYTKNVSINTFQVSLTSGGATVDLTTIGSGTLNVGVPHNLLNNEKIVITNSNSTLTINGVNTITWLSPISFSIPVNVTASGSGAAVFQTVEAAEGSSDEEQPHRIYYSKYQQPESVPIVNYIDIGATDKAILRIFPLRDSLFIFKQDGLYRLSGEVAPFSVALFDSSCILLAPDSVSISNNQVYAWTTQGISVITEAGVSIISRPIDTEILKKASSQFTSFKSATWGVGYESDNSYTVYTTDQIDDQCATIGFRYSNLTNTWTTVDKTATAGLINPADDKLYLGAGDTNYLEKERKEFTRYDYADRELSFSIASGALSDYSINLSTISGLSVGDVVVQDQTLTVYEFNGLLEKLDIDSGINNPIYYSTLKASAGDNLRTKIEQLATRLDLNATPGYSAAIASLGGAVLGASIANPAVITTVNPHGLQTGRKVTISGNSDPEIDGNFLVTVLDLTRFTVPVDLLVSATGGSFVTVDNDFQDIKTCYNIIISRLNSDPKVSYSNYRPIDNNTIQEAIITAIDIPHKKITLNLDLDYVFGSITIYKAIPCRFTYSPITMGDPLGLKHLREATMMFASKAFTSAEMEFSTDLLPEVIQIPFNGDGNGIFGHQTFGSGFFGGGSNSAPFRTYIPRQCQRCRYINVGFIHSIAREQYAIYGITLTGEVGQSTRAYR